MKITYDKSDQSIQIKDGLKPTYFILKVLMFLNLANALIRLMGQAASDYGVIEYIWISIGIASLMALFYLFLKYPPRRKYQSTALSP